MHKATQNVEFGVVVVVHVDHSKSQSTDDKLSLEGAVVTTSLTFGK